MNTRSTAASALLSAVLMLTVAACDTEAPSPPTSGTTTTRTPASATSSPTPTPTSSPTPTDDAGRAVAAVVAYWAAIDAASTNPKTKLETLASVARGQALAQWQTTIASDRAKSLTQVGQSQVVDGSATKQGGKFQVVACVDVSAVDVVDASGKSVVVEGRPDRQRYTYTVQKVSSGFYVTEDLLKGTSCDA